MPDRFYADLVLYLAGNSFRVYVIYRFLRLYFGPSRRGGGRIAAAYLAYFILLSGAYLCFHSLYMNVTLNLALTFALTFLYRDGMGRRLRAAGLICLVSLICETAVYRLMIVVFHVNNPSLGIVVPNMLLFSLVMILERLEDLKDGYHVPAASWISTIFMPLVSIYVEGIVLDDNPHVLWSAFAIAGILLMNAVIFYLLDHLTGAYRKAYELELQKRQAEAYENQLRLQKSADERVERLRHDLKNHIIALRILAENKNIDQLTDYLNDMDESLKSSDEFVQSGNVVLDGIVNMKLRDAARLNTELHVDVNVPCEFGISDLDLNIILGNLLDNALRALEESRVRKLWVEIYLTSNLLLIRIENTYTGPSYWLDGKLETTKKQKAGHGIGLSSVRKTVEKYHGALDIRHENDIFAVKIIIYLNQSERQTGTQEREKRR
ncbi:sensor histidine kinase [Bacilliculturomica massiliensis]|uniref:sensor histidine kinase n=1 Tax=Bacilliculturomica massiliensis TaxID=1917867 RepID=UPI0010307683|nr:sensor histidine kinase [Bacilliculturomica massiliensis]